MALSRSSPRPAGRVVLVTGGMRGVGAGHHRGVRRRGRAGSSPARVRRSTACRTSSTLRRPRPRRGRRRWSTPIVDGTAGSTSLVNNAGGSPYALAADASPRFHEKIVGLNLLAPLLCVAGRQRGDAAQDGGGVDRQRSPASAAARPSPGTAAYGAAKAGLDCLTASLAVEWAPKVRVNAIDVGLCRTEQTDHSTATTTQVAAIERHHPARPDGRAR